MAAGVAQVMVGVVLFTVRVTVAVEDLLVSAWLVAVTVTVCWAEIVAGAVYSPDVLIVPTPAGLIVHVTAVLALFVVAVNCCVWPAYSKLVEGETLTVMLSKGSPLMPNVEFPLMSILSATSIR
jgi:hypothetical protein